MKIVREKLIKFYDERAHDAGRGSDVSALTALWGEDLLLGVLQHYWRSEGAESEILSYSCSTGNRKGPRLDGWLLKRSCGTEFLYQVEVKNWAAYSLGERQLEFAASEEELRRYSEEQWKHYFGGDTIPAPSVAKVLVEMKKPDGYDGWQVTPLLCFWFFIAESLESSYSRHHYPDGRAVHVFSASAYLRSIKEEFIEISMPRAERRLKLLSDLIDKNA
ncbi:hypothetical protein DB347_17605 [Opitutaceae bacterium EW11]|nr:hypothetical protein DB347_17605 [Opitutaceae bacterium EW11]